MAHSVNEAIKTIEAKPEPLEFASLDHDLGSYSSEGGNGSRLITWMLENNSFPTEGIRVHSANITGSREMLALIDSVDPYGDAEDAIYSFTDYRGNRPTGGWPIAH